MRVLDAAAIVIYLGLMVVAGLYFSGRNKTTEAYFLGNREFPAWAIGLSMLGTSVSSITFLAIPAAAYALDWRQLVAQLMLPLVTVVAVVVFIPLFRARRRTSAFEYLSTRFGKAAGVYGAITFILLQVIRLGMVLFLMSLPLALMTGTPLPWIICVVGVLVALYTVAGGIEAVIWTDVVQAIVLIAGGALCVISITTTLPDGLADVVRVGGEQDKFFLGELAIAIDSRTLLALAILGAFTWVGMYAGDQNIIQRILAARSTRDARKAATLFTAVALPTWLLFFFLGTSLFVYYHVFPDPNVEQLEADLVLPHFILSRIPAGIAGLVIAAVIASAMSTLDSGINAVSTVTVVDLVRPFLLKEKSDQYYLRTARLVGVAVSVLMILAAFVFSKIEKESMVDASFIAISVFGGCAGAMFLLGFFSRRVDNVSVLTALVFATALNVFLGIAVALSRPAVVESEMPAPSDGRLSADAVLGFVTGEHESIAVTVPRDDSNTSVDDLAQDIRRALRRKNTRDGTNLAKLVLVRSDRQHLQVRTRKSGRGAFLRLTTSEDDVFVTELGFAPQLEARGSSILPWDVHAYWITMIVNPIFIALALVVTLIRGKPPSNIDGLTVWTLRSGRQTS